MFYLSANYSEHSGSEKRREKVQFLYSARKYICNKTISGSIVACEMYESSSVAKLNCICLSVCLAGDAIAQLTDVGSALPSQSDGRITVFSDRTGMVKAARLLLSSVTKVLVLADRIVIKQIITSRNKVSYIDYL